MLRSGYHSEWVFFVVATFWFSHGITIAVDDESNKKTYIILSFLIFRSEFKSTLKKMEKIYIIFWSVWVCISIIVQYSYYRPIFISVNTNFKWPAPMQANNALVTAVLIITFLDLILSQIFVILKQRLSFVRRNFMTLLLFAHFSFFWHFSSAPF